MDEFLYILIGIAWLAFSFYQQSQKKKRQQDARRVAIERENASDQEMQQSRQQDDLIENPGAEVSKKTDFKRALEEILLGEQISLETIPDKEAQSLETITESEYLKESETEFPSRLAKAEEASLTWSGLEKRTPESVEQMKDELEKNMVLEEDNREEESVKHYFNLRDAIIYSEILKPKYVN
jgi:hypothetical protein